MDDEQVHLDVQDALADAFQKHERSMLGRWVVIAESVEDSGERGVWTLAGPDNLAHETIGLLHFGLARIRASVEDDEDDD